MFSELWAAFRRINGYLVGLIGTIIGVAAFYYLSSDKVSLGFLLPPAILFLDKGFSAEYRSIDGLFISSDGANSLEQIKKLFQLYLARNTAYLSTFKWTRFNEKGAQTSKLIFQGFLGLLAIYFLYRAIRLVSVWWILH